VNVVFDPVGGSVLAEAMKTVAWGAQYIVIGFAAGQIPRIPANILLVKNTTVHGTFWGSYLQHSPRLLHESMRQVLAWLVEGRIKVHISHRCGGLRSWAHPRPAVPRALVGGAMVHAAHSPLLGNAS
jgi:NADPH:quinone reductase